MAYRDDAGDVLAAPTAEGMLRAELAPRAVKLTVAARTLHVVDRLATLIDHGRRDRRVSLKIEGRLVIARDVPREDLGVWIELDPGDRERGGMRRIFGVAPVSLLEPDGLVALGVLDRLAHRLRLALGEHARDVRRAIELGRGLDKVLLADHGGRYAVYARRLFRDRARLSLSAYSGGRIVVHEGKQAREVVVRSRHAVDVIGDYVRFLAPDGEDLARVSIPWITPEDRRELARRIGLLVESGAAAVAAGSENSRERGKDPA